MPNTQQLRMEDMSVAYVRALCAVNGYSIGRVEHDNDGYDITINCSGCPADKCKKHSPSIQVQLKSSYAKIHNNNDGTISYTLEVGNYLSLIDDKRITPLILVVLHMHAQEEQWIEQTSDYLKITKCAYWKSLVGKTPTNNTETINIKFTSDDLFTVETLKDIMIKVSNEQPL